MGHKGKEVCSNIRKLIIAHYKDKKSYRKISEIVKIPKSTVFDIISLYKKTKSVEKRKRSGRPMIFSEPEKRWIVYQIKKNPKLSAVKLRNQVNEHLNKRVNPETIRNILRQNNLHGRIIRKKPFINRRNRLKRLRFAVSHINKSIDFWRTVIFADESKYNIFGSDGISRVWRQPNTEFEERNLRTTVKHGGGHQMVWGCMAASGVGNLHFIEGRVNKYDYLNILKQNLKQSAIRLGLENCFKYYEDNDPKHTSDICKLWLLYNCPKVISTTPQSPDLNPIEHLWEHLNLKIRQQEITNKEILQTRLQEEWNRIDPAFCEKLVSSMPSRLREVIKKRGRVTKY